MSEYNNDSSWYCITLTPEQKEFGFDEIIRAEMGEIWIARGAQEGVSVWLKESDSETKIYFSPIAAETAQMLIFRFNGVPCPKPPFDSVTFMLGHVFYDKPAGESTDS